MSEPVEQSRPSSPSLREHLTPRSVGMAALLVAAGAGLLAAVWRFYPLGVDWEATFYPAFKDFLHPYSIFTFTSPPWVLVLLPHALLDVTWSNAINLLLNVAVLGAAIYRYKGGWRAIVLTFTSAMMLDLARTNNIDWIPLLAFLIPPTWGLPLLAIKPQVLGGAALIWWKRRRFSPLMLAPLAVVVAASLVVWGFWPLKIGLISGAHLWNFAPWPLGVPFGGYLLYKAYRTDDEILAASATPLLVPYFAPYSLAPLMALLSSRYRREALYLYCVFWFYFIIDGRRFSAL